MTWRARPGEICSRNEKGRYPGRMDQQLQTRIEHAEPLCVERAGEVVWICLAKLKEHRERAMPSLPWIGGEGGDDDSASEEVTATLFVVQGSGKDPDAAIRDATERVLRYSSVPPPRTTTVPPPFTE